MAICFTRLIELLSDLFIQAFMSSWNLVESILMANCEAIKVHRPNWKRRSIVRIIGTYLPLPSAPRVYLNLAAWNSYTSSYISSVTLQNELSEREEIEESNEECLHSENCETQAAIRCLQEELNELRSQIAAILENQCNLVKDVARGDLSDSEDDEVSSTTVPQRAAPPPPPPPMPPTPPPLPPPLAAATPKLQISSQRRINGYCANNAAPSTMHILGQVLSEMKNGRPKLKPIQRSPGGGPLKIPKPVDDNSDPSDVLKEVLRRRFSMAQMSDTTNESDSSTLTDRASSPEWKIGVC